MRIDWMKLWAWAMAWTIGVVFWVAVAVGVAVIVGCRQYRITICNPAEIVSVTVYSDKAVEVPVNADVSGGKLK